MMVDASPIFNFFCSRFIDFLQDGPKCCRFILSDMEAESKAFLIFTVVFIIEIKVNIYFVY
jgi:hypothetical protein